MAPAHRHSLAWPAPVPTAALGVLHHHHTVHPVLLAKRDYTHRHAMLRYSATAGIQHSVGRLPSLASITAPHFCQTTPIL